MSAWLVNKQHVDVLVTAAIALGLIPEEKATETGDDLWQENVKSICARYGRERLIREGTRLPEPGSYVFSPLPVEDLEYVFKQAACYSYQSCEHEGWESSAAAAFIAGLSQRVAEVLGTDYEGMHSRPGWERATWGVYLDEEGRVIPTQSEWSAWLKRERKREGAA